MSFRKHAQIASMLVLLLVFPGCLHVAPVTMEIITTPYAIPSASGTTLVYEIVLSDYRTDDLTLNKVEVFTDNTLCRTFTKEDFQPEAPDTPVFLTFPKTITGLDDTYMCKQPVLYFAIPLNTGENTPAMLSHKLYFTKKILCCDLPMSFAGGDAQLSTEPLLVIEPPFRGDRLAASEVMMAWTHHRQGIAMIDDKPYVSQRFAVDWFRLTEGGTMCSAPFEVNANHSCYGMDLIAVAPGKVVKVLDGVPDNTPPGRAETITNDTVAGNLVVIQIAENRFAFYGHCIPGSILVHEGDDVVTGQVVAKVGNSGNSDAPHLHFQISDGTSLFESQGIPFLLDTFSYDGIYELWNADLPIDTGAVQFTWTPLTPVERTNEFLDNGMVCAF